MRTNGNRNRNRQLFEAIMLNEDWQSTLADYKNQHARAVRQYRFARDRNRDTAPDGSKFTDKEFYNDGEFSLRTYLKDDYAGKKVIIRVYNKKYSIYHDIESYWGFTEDKLKKMIRQEVGSLLKNVVFGIGDKYYNNYYRGDYTDPKYDAIIDDIGKYCRMIKEGNSDVENAIFQEIKQFSEETNAYDNRARNIKQAYNNRLEKVNPIYDKARQEFEDEYSVSIGDKITLDGKKDPWEVIDIQGDQVKLKSPGGATKYVPVSYAETKGRHLTPNELRRVSDWYEM